VTERRSEFTERTLPPSSFARTRLAIAFLSIATGIVTTDGAGREPDPGELSNRELMSIREP